LTGAALLQAIMAIWCICFCDMQWRAIGLLCNIPFGTLYTLFARWTRLSLWRRLLNRLILAWRQACGGKRAPTAVIIDSQSCPSAPSCFTHGFAGGKKIKGIKVHLAVDKYGFSLAINVSPANRHGPWQRRQAVQQGHRPGAASACWPRRQGNRPGRSRLSGPAAVQGWRGAGISIQPSAGGHGGIIIPEGIRWVVERSLAWIGLYLRLNTIFERTKAHLVAFSKSVSSPSCPATWYALRPGKSAPDSTNRH
jgi:hypothetical protein